MRPSDQASVRPFQLSDIDRDPSRVHAEAVKKPTKCLFWPQGRLARVEPAQVHIQLAVFKPPGDAMGEADSQRSFANPSCTVDHADHHCAVSPRDGQAFELLKLTLAAGKPGHVEGQLRWYQPGLCGSRVEPRRSGRRSWRSCLHRRQHFLG